jgi:hypothetical protein
MTERDFWEIVYRALVMVARAIERRYELRQHFSSPS